MNTRIVGRLATKSDVAPGAVAAPVSVLVGLVDENALVLVLVLEVGDAPLVAVGADDELEDVESRSCPMVMTRCMHQSARRE
jgi:hypothetical protein